MTKKQYSTKRVLCTLFICDLNQAVARLESLKPSYHLQGYWGPGVWQRLNTPPMTISASNKPIFGVQLWQDTIYCSSEAGTVKAFNARSGQQVITVVLPCVDLS